MVEVDAADELSVVERSSALFVAEDDREDDAADADGSILSAEALDAE